MAIDRSDIRRVAQIARLGIAEEEEAAFADSLAYLFGLIDEMAAADTDGVDALAHPLDFRQRLRDDVVAESDQRETFQALAPHVENGLYLVPKVIE